MLFALMVVHQHEATQLRAEVPWVPSGSGATMLGPSGVNQRSRW